VLERGPSWFYPAVAVTIDLSSTTSIQPIALESIMRATLALILAITGATAGMAALPGDAEAAGQYYRYRGKIYRKACNHDCARANALDPAGNYKGYPDWARAALSPKTDGRRSR
jgi:hypothetical protein